MAQRASAAATTCWCHMTECHGHVTTARWHLWWTARWRRVWACHGHVTTARWRHWWTAQWRLACACHGHMTTARWRHWWTARWRLACACRDRWRPACYDPRDQPCRVAVRPWQPRHTCNIATPRDGDKHVKSNHALLCSVISAWTLMRYRSDQCIHLYRSSHKLFTKMLSTQVRRTSRKILNITPPFHAIANHVRETRT